jgi:tetratricopeptide (TPR) repeat protein
MSERCQRCKAVLGYEETTCGVCKSFVGYPNVRRADAMKSALENHYCQALEDAEMRGYVSQVRDLEVLLKNSVATINVTPKLLYCVAADGRYVSYYKAVDRGIRKIAERKYHAHRGVVDAAVHTGYETEIINAAVSPDGRGLTNYGPVTFQLRESTFGHRASVLRENAFDFFRRHDLGGLDTEEPPGWRSNWESRALLGVAHLAPEISSTTFDLENLILSTGRTRPEDRYLEVHIHGDVPLQSLSSATLEESLADAEKEDWEFGRAKLLEHGVIVTGFDENVDAHIRHAEKLSGLGRLDEALAAYDQAIASFPQDVAVRNGRAETLRQIGRLDEALAAFEEVMTRFPQDLVAHTGRAKTLRELGRYDEEAFKRDMKHLAELFGVSAETIGRWASSPNGRTEPPAAASAVDTKSDDDLVAEPSNVEGAISVAHLCGPLGQALAVMNGKTWLYDGNNRRSATHNDIRFFFEYGLETYPAAARTERDLVAALNLETRCHQALKSVLMGLDGGLADDLRRRAMLRAERLLEDDAVARFAKARLSTLTARKDWNMDEARRLARRFRTFSVASLYGGDEKSVQGSPGCIPRRAA